MSVIPIFLRRACAAIVIIVAALAAGLAAAEDAAVSFRRDVMPVFFRANCNSGGCHGAAAGKDGFNLSLFGYDAAGDYFRLTQQIVGRRIDVAAPEESLILLKATNKVPHTGGKLFDEHSEHYAALLAWIRQGAGDDASDVPQATGIALEPASLLFDTARDPRQLRVTAKYADGTTRDVTRLALFSTNNKSVADISADGLVNAGGRGATDVFARFDRFTVGAEAIVLPVGDAYTWPADAKPLTFVDEHVHARLKQLRILPAVVCDDATFLRRVSLDLIGLPPTEDEFQAFMSSTGPDKRTKLVDSLLARPEYAEVWAAKWATWLKLIADTYSGGGYDHKASLAYFEWLVDQFSRNVPLDQFVRAQVASRGSNFIDPPTNFYTMVPGGTFVPKSMAQDTAQLFTGIRINCAECHNHPFDRWTQDDYYGFVSFFTGVKRKNASEPREFYIYNDNAAPPAKHMLDDRPMPPKFLGGDLANSAGVDPRAALADWLTASRNDLFTSNMANRIWAHFFGRGIVEPIDDCRVTNPPSNRPLLEALAARLAATGFDQKALIRDIVNSRTYQLSSRVNNTNRGDDRQFSHAPVRRLTAAVAIDVIAAATATETRFKGLPPGYRAMQVYDSGRRRDNYFLTAFGQSDRKTVCAADEVVDPSLAQTLHLINGDTISRAIHDSRIVGDALAAQTPPEQIIERLFIRTLGRRPETREIDDFKAIAGALPKRVDYDNLWWAFFNSTEFLFQH